MKTIAQRLIEDGYDNFTILAGVKSNQLKLSYNEGTGATTIHCLADGSVIVEPTPPKDVNHSNFNCPSTQELKDSMSPDEMLDELEEHRKNTKCMQLYGCPMYMLDEFYPQEAISDMLERL